MCIGNIVKRENAPAKLEEEIGAKRDECPKGDLI